MWVENEVPAPEEGGTISVIAGYLSVRRARKTLLDQIKTQLARWMQQRPHTPGQCWGSMGCSGPPVPGHKGTAHHL